MKMMIRTAEGFREIEERVQKVVTGRDGRLQVIYYPKGQGGWLGTSTIYRKGAVIETVELESEEE